MRTAKTFPMTTMLKGPHTFGVMEKKQERELVRTRFLTQSGNWSKPCSKLSSMDCKEPITIDLHRGGRITIFPNLLERQNSNKIKMEILKSRSFRQYKIQATNEPRCHFIAHEDATERFDDDQPGYRYGTTTMKSVPLKRFPKLERLSREMAKMVGISKWNIGVNPVLFRNQQDSMGEHSGESPSMISSVASFDIC